MESQSQQLKGRNEEKPRKEISAAQDGMGKALWLSELGCFLEDVSVPNYSR